MRVLYLLVVILVLTLCNSPFANAAAPIVDNNNGSWTDNFNDQLGSSTLNNVELDVFSGSASLAAGQISGSQTTVIIDPPSSDTWQTVCLDATYSNQTDLTIDILNGADNVPVIGFQGLDLGQADVEGCIDISGVDINLYPTLKIRINHTKGATTPIVKQLIVNWNPVTFLLFDKVAPEEIGAGQSFPYKIRVSANFVDAVDLVIWDTLPKLSRGTVTYESGEDYGQNDEPLLATIKRPNGTEDTLISHNGNYTATAIMVNGVSVPEHSVYWTFDKLKAGKSIVLQAFMVAPNGTLDGTQYFNAANAIVANGANKTAPTVATTVRSIPAPKLTKAQPTLDRPGQSRVFKIGEENLVLEGNTLRFYIKDPDGSTDGNDYAPELRERMYNTVLFDTLGDLLPYLSATPFDIEGIKHFVYGTNQVINGIYTTVPVTIGTTTVPANSVYWNLGTMNPGDGYSMDFKVTLNGSIPDQTETSNFAYLDSDQTDLLVDELPMIVVAEIPGAGYCCKSGYFPTYEANEQDLNCHPLDGSVPIIYGDPIQYRLHYRNIGGTLLQDMAFFDRVPDEVDFVSADFEDAALVNGTIFYYTNTDYPDSIIHPPFDYSLLPNPGTGWTTTAPATASDVTWVAWTVPQMSSSYFPPANPITEVTALMNVVTDNNPPNPCIQQRIHNTKIVEINAEAPAGGAKTVVFPPRTHHYTDTTSVRANIGEFDVDATDIELTPIALIPGNAYYTINIKNLKSSRSDYFKNVLVQLDWTQLNVNGTLAYPTFINATGGTFTNFDPVNGTITLDIGALAQGEEKEVGMELNFPIGTEDLSTYKITATLTGIDNQCDPVVATHERTALVSGAPAIQVFKDDVVDVIPSAGEIRYELSYRNIGESPSTNTWVTDRIPFRTTFVKAMAAQGEQVWFTDKLPPDLPANQISVINPIRFRTIQQHFSLGILDDKGTPVDYTDDEWTSPFGDQTTWIAWKVDDPTYTPNLLPVNPTFRMVEMIVRNDDDGTGVALDGSPAGTVIFNEEAVFSKQNLLAVGNEVRTTIEDFPGLELNKRSDVEIVTSAESFNWIIDYRNNSHATDDIVTITDNLPFEVDLNTIHHQWNAIAIANGQVGTNTDITANSNVTITVNGSGSATIEIKIAGSTGLKSDLLSEEGGTITLNVTPKNSTSSGVVLDNEVCGVGQNALSTTYLCDNDLVTVLNPDLLVSKITSTTEPNSGDTVTYTLLIANRGLHDAEGVVIQDMLPTGATYIAGSTQLLTGGYSVSEPAGTSTLIWNDLQQTTGGTAGTIPQSSADIYLSYRLKITGNVQDMPENSVMVSTTDPEDNTYPNVDTTTVLIPPPDPTITKTGQRIAAPGDAVTWTMDYYNTRNAPATGVYIIEALPDFDNDGDADVDFINTIPPSGVTVYYSAITGNPPAFDTSNPTGSGNWTSSTGATVNHLAYLIGNMDANATIASINITAALKDPNTGVLPPAGTTFSNQVEIFLNETEGDITNNRDTFETKVPGIDVSITKEGSMEGGFPGLRPGDAISYIFTVQNNGTVTAHGLSVTDQLPSNFVPAEPFDEFTAIEIYDAFGLPIDLLDPTDAAITIPIEPTRTGTVASGNLITWYLGTTSNTADADHYRNVGIPVGATLSFTINGTVAGDAKEGDKVSNSTTVTYEGIPSNILPEEFLNNNTDSTTVTIYRPDVMIQKSVMDKPTSDETWTESGNTLTYNLEYNNIGNAGADNVVISEIIPVGTTYEDGSLTLPPGASVEWFPTVEAPTAFDITIPFLPAPANYDAEFGDEEVDLNCTDLNATMNEQVIEPVTGNTNIPAAPSAPAAPITLPSAPPIAPAAPALPAIPANIGLKGGVTLGSCDCATQVDLPEIECEALVALYDSLDGSNWTGFATVWGTNNSPCSWTGIACIGGQVDEISLNNSTAVPLGGVSGNLPPELGNLSALDRLLIANLEVGGDLPPEWANMGNVTHLQIANSNIIGNLPPEWANMSKLKALLLSSTTANVAAGRGLTGGIPEEYGHLTTLTNLQLTALNLGEPLPAQLGLLTNLTDFRFINAGLTGTIPPELGHLTNLIRFIIVGDENLIGNVPAELGHLVNISQQFYIYSNGVSGILPPELGNLTKAKDFRMNSNALTGPIPPEFGNLTGATVLLLNQNDLSGTLPPELGNLTGLTNFQIQGNDITGIIPPELGNMISMSAFNIGQNDFICHLPEALLNIPAAANFTATENAFTWDGGSTYPNISVSPLWNEFFNDNPTDRFSAQNAVVPNIDTSVCHIGYSTVNATIVNKPICGNTDDLNGWVAFKPQEVLPTGTAIQYTFYREDVDGDGICSNNSAAALGPVSTNSNGIVDMSGISSTYDCLCVETQLITTIDSITPELNGFTTTFTRGRDHYFDFTALNHRDELCNGVGLREQVVEPITGNTTPPTPPPPPPLDALPPLPTLDPAPPAPLPPNMLNPDDVGSAYAGDWPGYCALYPGLCNTALDGPIDFTDYTRFPGLDPSSLPALKGGVTLGSCDCSTQTDLPELECEAIVALYDSLGGTGWVNVTPVWGSNNSPCGWGGIDCVSGQINQIELRTSNNLVGVLPAELGNLTAMTLLRLQTAPDMVGTIPPELGNCTSLTNLLLNGSLTGSIPPELGNLTSMVNLWFNSNDLTGGIPPELGNLTNIRALVIDSNPYGGTIPPELGNLTLATDFRIYKCDLTGTIPPELGNLVNVERFYLSENDLTGSIPPELGNLIKSKYVFWLNGNDLTGSIPPELGHLTDLLDMNLSSNALTGPIPPELGNLINLVKLNIHVNALTGELPPELANLAAMTTFYARTNNLSGTLPPEYGHLDVLSQLFLYDNNLTGELPPEWGHMDGLQFFSANNNQLSGGLPAEWAHMPALRNVELIGNNLTGSLPAEWGGITTLFRLYLQNNEFTCHIPEEWANLTNISTSANFRIAPNKLVLNGTGVYPNWSSSSVLNTWFENQVLSTQILPQTAYTDDDDISACILEYPETGSFATPIYSTGTLQSWDLLRTDQALPDNTELTYTLYTQGIDPDAGCTGSPINGFEDFTLENGFIDISTIPNANTELCLKANFKSDAAKDFTPCLDAWQATYISQELPKITFEVAIDNPVTAGQTQIDNDVSISTITPELDSNVVNNTAADSIYLRFTDLAITKEVDKAAILAPDDAALTYQVIWENLGPQEAINAIITDILPVNVAYDAATPTPTTVDTDYQGSGRTALIWDLGNQLTGAIDTISITVHETNAAIGENLSNIVSIKNDRQETDYENNEDEALTVVDALANVYIKKDGPVVMEINETGQFQLIYGNNGNDNAGNVVVTDEIPMAFRPIGADNPNCSIAFQSITCNLGDLAAGAEDTILIDFMVGSNPALIGTSAINTAQISTDSSETDLSDNQDDHETFIELLQLANISGTVWHDDDRNGYIDGVENGIEAVVIHLTGTDIFGENVQFSTTTDVNGYYSFSGLTPGTYHVEEEQPTGWLSSPYAKLGWILRTTNTPQDTLVNQGMLGTLNSNEAFETIILEGGYRGIEYNFGEDLGSIGDTVWIDTNVNGIQEVGEVGVEGITVRLYQSSNDSLIGTESTNALGAYLFEDLYANDYYAVFDLMSLPDSINRVTIQNATSATTLTDSDADPTTGITMVINLAAGEDDLSWDMGIYGAILIGNYIWIDTNKDGIQDETDVPIEGINVTLFNSTGDSITTVQTNADGYYYFHTDTLALANNGNDTLLYPNMDYYLAVGLGDQFNANFGLLFDSLKLTLDSIGTDVTDSNGELAFNINPDFDGFPFLKITTPDFGQVDTTFDFGFQPVDFDWGDLPDTSDVTNTSDYQTIDENNGPHHVIIAGLNLGNTIDGENDGQADENALGDGIDEDGLVLLASMNISPGGMIRLPFSYMNTTDSTAYLKIWIDWDGDGQFKTVGEEIVAANDSSSSFPDYLEIPVPINATKGLLLGIRVRLSLEDDMTPYGLMPNGEVEDYLIGIDCKQVCLPIESTIIRE